VFSRYGQRFNSLFSERYACVDLELLWIYGVNAGVEFPGAYVIPPSLTNRAFFPAICLKNAQTEFNFGATSFKFPPKEFNAVSTAPISDTSVGSVVKANKG